MRGHLQHLCVLVVMAFLFTLSVRADYQLGLDAYQQGDFDRAFAEWMKIVASSRTDVNPAIMAETYYAIGMLFWIGQGVPQDTSASANWLREAAEMNHAGAQAKLGYLYSSGQGVPQSDFEAFKWFQMAARQGDADAQFNLAVLYRDGLGVAADPVQAQHWFREAAANGDPVSAGIIAEYEAGLPVLDGVADVELSGRSELVREEPSPGSKPTGEEAALNPPSRHTETWIRQQDPEHYTIQVIALLQPNKLYDFIDRHGDLEPFAVYRQHWQGKPLWVLVQGDYLDVEQARAAALNFPEDLQQRDNLWIRRFVMVQGSLL